MTVSMCEESFTSRCLQAAPFQGSRKAVRADTLSSRGRVCSQPTGSRRASPCSPCAMGGGVGGSGCGAASRGSALTSLLLPVLPARPGEDRQLGSSVFSASFWTPCRRVWPPWDLWSGEGESPQSSAPECSVMNRCGGTQRTGLLLSVGPRGMTRGQSPGEGARAET